MNRMAQSSASTPETHGAPSASFLNRTLRGAWRAIAGVARGKSAEFAPELPAENIPRLKKQIRECVEVRGGEVSTRARAAALGATYLSLSSEGRRTGVIPGDLLSDLKNPRSGGNAIFVFALPE